MVKLFFVQLRQMHSRSTDYIISGDSLQAAKEGCADYLIYFCKKKKKSFSRLSLANVLCNLSGHENVPRDCSRPQARQMMTGENA